MSERASIRGAVPRGSRGGRGDHRGGRGGAQGHPPSAGSQQQQERPKKENILDLSKYADKRITVKFNGGREVIGTLKGYDQLLNLVLDDVEEKVQDANGATSTRPLGLLVARGTLLVSISPLDGSEEIANPFLNADDDDDHHDHDA